MHDLDTQGDEVLVEFLAPLSGERIQKIAKSHEGSTYVEGDILVTPLDPMRFSANYTIFGHIIIEPSGIWDNGEIPYRCEESLEPIVEQAIALWEERTPIRFIKHSTQAHVADFVSYARNESHVGCIRQGFQEVCLREDASLPIVMHEIGHLVGLWHEHSRIDRNDHIVVYSENITTGNSNNFDTILTNVDADSEYDPLSLMHYHSYEFSNDNGPTILTRSGDYIEQPQALSNGDINAVSKLYS